MGELRRDRPVRKMAGSSKQLARSIRKNGLRVRVLVNPADGSLISGYRRLEAYHTVRSVAVPAALPGDIEEACRELGTHVTDPDRIYAVPMTARDKLELALRLGELPRPASAVSYNTDGRIGPAVGLSSSLLWRMRSVLGRAEEGEAAPSPEALAARRVLALMLQAVDHPVQGWTVSNSVRALHAGWLKGRIPDCLAEVCPPDSVRNRPQRRAAAVPVAAACPPVPRQPLSSRPVQAELRRGVDAISGACAGLASLPIAAIPAADAGYIVREIKRNQMILRRVLKSVQEG